MRSLLAALVTMAVVAVIAPASYAAPAVPDCKGALEPSVPGGCQGVANVGCCDPLGRNLWCQGADLYCLDCNQGFEACGWNGLGYYDCGQDAGAADPSGANPLSCEACPAECAADAACGPTCVGGCGTCAGAGEVCLDDGSCYAPQCDGKACGLDPLGLSCGACAAGTECVEGLFQCLPLPTGCAPRDASGCDDCGCQACVCETYPSCCTDGWDALCAAACVSCGQDCSPCPTEPTCDGIGCGSFCGLDCGSCAAAEVCAGNQCCAPQCDGKACGSDGCGGTCGACPAFDSCVAGQCVVCQPQCDGKACGSDGCGGECGACGADEVCDGGQCSAGLCAGQCGQNQAVNCGGFNCWCYCNADCMQYGDCCTGVCDSCGDALDFCCEPDCDGKACGDDGCGGSCGACPVGEKCEASACVSCEPECAGKVCGDDGCGGSCGGCPAGQSCDGSGQCGACQPDCGGKACGDDGCGGLCGACPYGQGCQGGQCAGCGDVDWIGCCEGATSLWCQEAQLQQQDCGGGGCGWDPQNSFYNCGFTGADPTGASPIDCSGTCEPDCVGKACGADGCGGSCGSCPPSQVCEAGQCEETECGAITPAGCCDGDFFYGCQAGQLAGWSCGDTGCGWDGGLGAYRCGGGVDQDPSGLLPRACFPCSADCSGKVCGDNGCGGSCGGCPPGQGCEAGQCVEACDPGGFCEGRVCGVDPCGSSCGQCAAGEGCSPSGQCVAASADAGGADVGADVPSVGGGAGSDGCGGCDAGSGGGPAAAWWIALSLLALGLRRRRVELSG